MENPFIDSSNNGYWPSPIEVGKARTEWFDIWQRDYPFTYWHNRIEKVNEYNSQDRLEALYITLQLADLYVHILAARFRNPHFPWLVVKEETRKWHIDKVLDALRIDHGDETPIHLGKLADEPEDLISFEYRDGMEDWDVDLYDWVAADLLGCPVEFDTENKELVFPTDDPAEYIAVCDAIVNFWDENSELLNDFKHGFRVIPFQLETLEYLADTYDIETDFEGDIVDRIRQEVLQEQTDDWTLLFWRMATNDAEDAVKVELNVHRAHIRKCMTFSRIILKLLHNLFGQGGSYPVVDQALTMFDKPGDEEITLIEHLFVIGTFVTEMDPEETD